MKCLQSIISFAVLALFGLASAAIQKQTHTKNFADHTQHGTPSLNREAAAGLGTGFGILGVLMIFSCVKIIMEEMWKHKDQNQKTQAAIQKFRELGLNQKEIDDEYDEIILYRGKTEEQAALIRAKRQRRGGAVAVSQNDQGEHEERL
ncbi:UNKNOWN [Stylonychia lemnae]|uniref:Uncharacterized protein n=1 Tax=Stylonychia lemnae TaxID=5949 RepID=A0A078B007_STYLE|nr:UNKNOWN [Stylonychia lemnae]|eukprot:CDW88000.1 UNKNOWN [Stylonychia lemnae]